MQDYLNDIKNLKSRRKIFRGLEMESELYAAVLAELGYSNFYIKQKTGLSYGKITYRLKFLNIRRASYRNGESKVAKIVENSCFDQIANNVEKQVVKKLRFSEKI